MCCGRQEGALCPDTSAAHLRRYQVHQKLVGFMAPLEAEGMADTTKLVCGEEGVGLGELAAHGLKVRCTLEDVPFSGVLPSLNPPRDDLFSSLFGRRQDTTR